MSSFVDPQTPDGMPKVSDISVPFSKQYYTVCIIYIVLVDCGLFIVLVAVPCCVLRVVLPQLIVEF